jgi:hypothetical protein
MQVVKTHATQGGTLSYLKHDSVSTGTPMTLSVFTPPGDGPFPVLFWLIKKLLPARVEASLEHLSDELHHDLDTDADGHPLASAQVSDVRLPAPAHRGSRSETSYGEHSYGETPHGELGRPEPSSDEPPGVRTPPADPPPTDTSPSEPSPKENP